MDVVARRGDSASKGAFLDRTLQFLQWLAKLLGRPFILFFLVWFFSIWPIADWRCAPGGQLKVYMGLIEYTKPYPKELEPVRDKLVRSPPQLIASGVTQAEGTAALRSFRERERIYRLEGPDTGTSLDKMPIGTFGYVSGLLLDPSVKRLTVDGSVMNTEKSPGSRFVVQKNYAGDVAIVAYLSPDDSGSALRQGVDQRAITLFPNPRKGRADLLLIPEGALFRAGNKTIRNDAGEKIPVIDAVLGMPQIP